MVKVLKATDQENKPEERLKNMVVHLDNCLSRRTEMMKKLLAEFEQLEIDHLIESSDVPNLVRWHRKLTSRTISDDATVSKAYTILEYSLLFNLPRLFLLHQNKKNNIYWLSWMQNNWHSC